MNLLMLAAAAALAYHQFIDKNNHKHQMVAAAEAGSTKEVKKLLRKKINPDEKNDPVYGETALMVAARRGDVAMMKLLIEAGADVDYIANHDQSHQGRTALANALDSGSLEAIKVLLEADANVNEIVDIDIETKPEVHAHTLLVYALYKRCSQDIIKLLIEHGADVNKPNVAQGWTPLMIAAYFGLSDTAKELIAAGADIAVKNKSHNNHDARYYAKKMGHRHMVKILDDVVKVAL